jgi:hypothetical protein
MQEDVFRRFCGLLHSDSDTLEWFAKRYRDNSVRKFRGTLDEQVQNVGKLELAGYDVHVCINTGTERTTGGINTYHGCFIDVDYKSGHHAKHDFRMPPHFAVQTGNGWHIHWLLEPGGDIAEWRLVQKALARKFQTDEAVNLATQLVRPAGLRYNKTATNRLGDDCHTRLRTNTKSPARRYTLDELIIGFGLVLTPRPVFLAREITMKNRGCAGARAEQYLNKMAIAVEGDAGSMQTYKACKVGCDFGVSMDVFWPALLGWNCRCSPPWDERELQQKLESAYRNQTRNFGWRMSA